MREGVFFLARLRCGGQLCLCGPTGDWPQAQVESNKSWLPANLGDAWVTEQDRVTSAFQSISNQVHAYISQIREQGAAAFERGDYQRAQQLGHRGAQLEAFAGKVAELREEWVSLYAGVPATRVEIIQAPTRSYGGWLEAGLRTPQQAFRRPILQALVDMGGSGRTADVLDRVGKMMDRNLNQRDQEPLPSNPTSPRWRNTAQWERLAMVEAGLLADNSRHGVWEITAAGRQSLKGHTMQR